MPTALVRETPLHLLRAPDRWSAVVMVAVIQTQRLILVFVPILQL